MSKSEIIQHFGKPSFEDDGGNGTTALNYLNRDEPGRLREYEFSGFEVFVRGEKVVRWSAMHSSTRVYNSGERLRPPSKTGQPTGQGINTTSGIPSVSFHIVSETNTSESIYIDTSNLPRLGYVSRKPDLLVTEIESLSRGKTTSIRDGKQVDTPTLAIGLTAKDAIILGNLTKDNLGKQMLVMIADKPIVAPFIHGIIDTGYLLLEVVNESGAADLTVELQKLIKRK
ncbi:MAG: hypothetical protein HZC54_23980 [Verrucomicrobia bacterium]|nr:hypothetical protein [Verrucomicrobiota bacterium]